MTFFAHYDPETGALRGYYTPEIHDQIPEPAVELTEDQHRAALGIRANAVRDGLLVRVEDDISLEQVKAAKSRRLNALTDEHLAALVSDYPERETVSFAKQEAEARQLEKDPAAPAPHVRQIAANRGIPVAELAARILANVAEFEVASGAIIGTRQKYQDAIDAAMAAAEVEAIRFDFDGDGIADIEQPAKRGWFGWLTGK